MSRARNIKPGFFKNERLAECDSLARILFVGLWCEADREGRLEDRPKRLRAEYLPYDDCDANALLDQLAEHGFIVRYMAGEAKYIQVLAFSKHQNPHIREPKSSIPAPDEHSAGTVQAEECTGSAALFPLSPSLIPEQQTASQPVVPHAADRGARLPQDWQPSETELRWARDARPDVDAQAEVEKFRDHWHAKAGRDACKRDWSATWRNWIRNSRGSSHANRISGGSGRNLSVVERIEQNIADRKRREAGEREAITGVAG